MKNENTNTTSSSNEQEFEVPITVDFDEKQVIGTARIKLSELHRTLIGEGVYTFAPGFAVVGSDLKDDHVEFNDIELCEISLIPNYNPPQIKRKKKQSDEQY